jgi:hypothetical protein
MVYLLFRYISCTAADLEFERQELLRKERERLQAIQDVFK